MKHQVATPPERSRSGSAARPAERRTGDRRSGLTVVSDDRRSGPERRRSVDRREPAAGRVRQAMQLLIGAVATEDMSALAQRDVRAALRQLGYALDLLHH
jgi:hypothetical protein